MWLPMVIRPACFSGLCVLRGKYLNGTEKMFLSSQPTQKKRHPLAVNGPKSGWDSAKIGALASGTPELARAKKQQLKKPEQGQNDTGKPDKATRGACRLALHLTYLTSWCQQGCVTNNFLTAVQCSCGWLPTRLNRRLKQHDRPKQRTAATCQQRLWRLASKRLLAYASEFKRKSKTNI